MCSQSPSLVASAATGGQISTSFRGPLFWRASQSLSDRKPRKLTNITLALIKRQANKNPAIKAAYFKTSRPELPALPASPGPLYSTR